MIPTLPIEIACPKCGTKHAAQVQSIIDVEQNPEFKAALLGGNLNVVVCPSCGTLGTISTPLLYHDPEHELLLLFVPPELNLPLEERERLTGSLVNALMSALPVERRKGYFLNPRTVLTRQSLAEEILQADGITKEMLQEQRVRSQLLQDLLTAMDNEQQLGTLVEENREKIDYSLFLSLASAAEQSAAMGQEQVAQKLLGLREKLLSMVSIALPEPLPADTPPAEVVDRLLETSDERARWAFVVYNRPLLDYTFFQELTRRIDQASSEEAESLRQVRTELLEATEELDELSKEAQEARSQLMEEALKSPDPAQVLSEHRADVDLLFMSVLAVALRQAQERNEQERVKQLLALNETVLSMLQEGLPPQLRLINELLGAEYPQGTQQLLQERRSDWDADLLQMMDTLAADLEKQGRGPSAQQLKEIRGQAEAILQESGGDGGAEAPSG